MRLAGTGQEPEMQSHAAQQRAAEAVPFMSDSQTTSR